MSQKHHDFPLNPRFSLYFDESSVKLNNLVDLLCTPSNQRSPSSIKALQNLTKNIPFFKQIISEYEEKAHIECCAFLKYLYMQSMSIVFEAGDIGDLFYIILKGSVKVLVPEEHSRNLIECTVLMTGCVFGEFALAKNKPRSATVVCLENTHFAVLSKKDFIRILGNFTNKRFDEMADFLKGLPIFTGWSLNTLVRLSYLFRNLKFKRNQKLFSEGDRAENVYIIKSGEFELTKGIMIKRSPHIVIGKIGRPLKNTKKQETFLQGKMSIVGFGEVIGDDDALNGEFYSKTCTCYSTSAEVLKISSIEFKKRIRSEESLNILAEKNAFRVNHFTSAVKMIKEIQSPNEKNGIRSQKILNAELSPLSGSISPVYHSFRTHRPTASLSSPIFNANIKNSQIVLELKSLWK